MSVPRTRTLAYVLREQLTRAGPAGVANSLRQFIAPVAEVPDPGHVTIEQAGVLVTIPKLRTYEPLAGEGAICVADQTSILAIGTANPQGSPGGGGGGSQGPEGPQGPQGPAGPQGAPGVQGPAGTPGATGPAGSQGATGATGPQGPPGTGGTAGLLAYQTKNGGGNVYSANFGGVVNPLPAGDGGYMTLSYTPTVNCVWEVSLYIATVQKVDAAYHNAYGGIVLAPADTNGIANAWHNVTQHASVNLYEGRHVTRLFSLNAGIAYTASAAISPGGGTWCYYCALDYLWMTGKAWPR